MFALQVFAIWSLLKPKSRKKKSRTNKEDI
jgi:hypothetical protein